MCDPFTAAALIAASVGSGAQIKGAADTRAKNAKDLDAQTQLSAAEFDKRNQLAKDIFAENSTISKDTYNEMASLSDQEFQTRTGLSKDAFNKLSRIQQDQVARDFESAKTNVDTIRNARLGRDATIDQAAGARDSGFTSAVGARDSAYAATQQARKDAQDAARAQYDADTAEANATQDKFRGQGDSVVSELLAAFTPEAMAKRRADAIAAREALAAETATPTASNASATADENIRAAFDKYSKAGLAKAAAEARAGSELAGYTDAALSGDRVISRGNERTGFIKDAAARALAPLAAKLDASSLRYRNAGANADDRTADLRATFADRRNNINANYTDTSGRARADFAGRTSAADADLAAALGLSATRAAGETKPVVDYTGAMDDAYSAFFGNRQASAGTHGDTLIGANNTRLQGSNSASSNFENNSANINQWKMANANGSLWTSLGQFASAVAPTLLTIGQRSAFAKEANKPAGTA